MTNFLDILNRPPKRKAMQDDANFDRDEDWKGERFLVVDPTISGSSTGTSIFFNRALPPKKKAKR